MDELQIDDMRPGDSEAVLQIYREGLATGNASFELEAPSWEIWDQRHHIHSRLVARSGNCVVGWGALSPVSQRACYAGVAEASLYIAADCRGRGIGKRLLLALIESSEKHGIWMLQAGAFPENRASLHVQLLCGFRQVGRRERIGRHHGLWRDTILTERRSKIIGAEAAS